MKQLITLALLFLGSLGGNLISTATAQPAAALYVNDGVTTGDLFTSAAGNDAAGTGSAAAPFATVAQALRLAGPATQTIFIDAGTYTERVVLGVPVSLQGAGTATIFDGGLVPAATQTNEAGLLLTASGGTSSQPLTIAGITFQAYDYGIQAENSSGQANLLLQDIETLHNRRQGIFWRSLGGVQHLTFRRVRAAYTAESGNSNANGAGRGVYLVNGHKTNILFEACLFENNRRGGLDINDGSVSDLTVRNCQFAQNAGGALVILGGAGTRDGNGAFTSIAALLEGNTIRNNASNGLELKACTGTGRSSGAGSFVVRNNYVARTIGAPTSLSEDNAGLAFIDRDRDIIAVGGGVNGDLTTGGAFIQGNTIRGYLSDATSSYYQINGFGMVLEGAQNKVFGNEIAQCQRAIQVQDRPANGTGYTAFFDASRNGLVISAGDSVRGNRLDSCVTAIRGVNLTNPVDASLNWLGANTVTAVRGTTGTGGLIVTLGGPTTSFAEVSTFAPTGLIDYSPFLNSQVDAAPIAGFQPALDYLQVDHYSPQSAAADPLAEGVALVVENGTVNMAAAGYPESISITKSLTLTNNGATTLRDLALNAPGKVLTLGAPLTLSGSLVLAEGLLQTTAANLLTLAESATATAGHTASYVDGPLRKRGQQAFVFPLGKHGHWARLGISAPADSAAALTAEYQDAAYASLTASAPLSEVSQLEHWTLDGASTAASVSVRLFWESAFRSGIDDFSSDLQVAAFTGTDWQTAGNGGLGGSLSAGSVVSAQPVTGATVFTLGSRSPAVNPLSTQLLAFQADQPRPGVVDLEWTMTSEHNLYGYAVERAASAGTTSWQQIGFVASQGLNAQPLAYTYQDQAVQGLPQAFYRLRQTNPSGAARYSTVAAVLLTANPVATISSIAPATGPVGTSVVITGTNFTAATSVSFNGTAASFTLNSDTQLTASVPAGATTGPVAVTTPTGTATSAQAFTVSTDLVVSTARFIPAGTYRNITVTGPNGIASLSSQVTVTGAFVVQPGGRLKVSYAALPLQGPGRFELQPGGYLSTGQPVGISVSGTQGAIQVSGPRIFSSDATYEFGATMAMSTGSGLPDTVTTLITNTNSSVTLTRPVAIRRELRLVQGTFQLNGQRLTLLSDSTGSALVNQDDMAAFGTVTGGAAVVQRYLPASANPGLGYRHLAAPVSNTTISDLATSTFAPVVNAAYNSSATPNAVRPFPTVFGYDETRLTTSPATGYSAFDKGWASPASLTGALAVGKGYTVNLAAGQTVDFVGTLGSGNVVLNLTRGPGADAGWNFIGNPYPANLNWQAVTLPPTLDGSMYVYQSTSQYAGSYHSYVNGVGNPSIAMGQGFFVRVSDGSSAAQLTLTNSTRTIDGSPFQRPDADTRPRLQLALQAAASSLADMAYVYFETGATAGLDTRYDAVKLANPNGLGLSAIAAGKELAINGLPPLATALVVPLRVAVPQAGSYSLAVADLVNFAAGTTLYLRDNQLGTSTLLTASTRYSFTITGTVAAGRFAIEFRPGTATATAAQALAQQVQVYPNPAHHRFQLQLPSGSGEATLTLYNSIGQLISAQAVRGDRATVEAAAFAPGIYTLRVQVGAVSIAKRVVLD